MNEPESTVRTTNRSANQRVRPGRAGAGGALLLVLLALFATAGQAQETGQVTGQVLQAESGAPMGQVQVYVAGEGLGSLTRSNGRFVILNVPAGTHEIVAERIGHRTVRRQISLSGGEARELNFEMEREALGLDELVVTGTAGAARRREIGNTINQISPDQLAGDATVTTDMLQSAAPGMEVTGVGAGVGQGKRITLRGNSSVTMSNQPIIYVDGVRMMSGGFPQTAGRDYRSGRGANITVSPLDNINPEDIERIEVIKGSAATTLYGTEASAGVIQIFTKSGSEGAPVWSVETQQGIGWSREFGTPEVPYLRIEPWLETAHNQMYTASVRGGGENLQYFVSGQLNDETGVLPLDEQEKWVARGNFTFTPIDDLRFQWNTTYSNQEMQHTPQGNNAQGLTLNAFRAERNYFGSADPDVISQVLDFDIRQQIERFTTGGTVTYSPLTNLTNRLTIGYDFSQQEARQIRPFGFVFYSDGAILNNTWQNRVMTFDYVGTYEFDLTDAVGSSFSWGGQAVGEEQRELEGWGEGFPGAAEPTVSSAAQKIAEEERQKVWNAGFFAQNVFDLRDRYFLTLGFRVDGNSAFGEDFGLQFYPKASGSWVISDEQFWADGWGSMKLRAAYGESGRAPGAFDAVRTWNAPGWAGQPAFQPRNVGNPNLGPEVTREIEAGFDGAWWDERLTADFTYYRQKTTDALFDVSQIPSMGFPGSQLENVGELENSGIEVALDASVVRQREWGWDLGLDIATNSSEVIDLGGAPEFSSLEGWIIEGHPVPVVRDERITNPDEIGDPEVEEEHIYGPKTPTLTLNPSTTVRLPGGVSVSARGEYRGGHYMDVNPMSVSRSVRSPLCYPYYQDPQNSIELKDGVPALWRGRCTPELVESGFYQFEADYFRLRSVSARIPVEFAFPQRVDNATLSLSLNNSYLWMKEIPWYDPEIMGNQGINDDGIDATERIPAPITFRAGLRLSF